MAGHSQKHPYLKSFDELKRTYNRLETYLDIYYETIPDDEKESIAIIMEKIDVAIKQIPEKYHITRWNQFKNK
jgi:uncharacterized protein YsxB (DUF464 family)